MALKFKFKMDTNTMAAHIKHGILKGTLNMVKDTKKQLSADSNSPRIYQNRGGALSQMLALTGLDKYTIAGNLKRSWLTQVQGIGVKYTSDTLIINMFDSKPLDDGTKWIGLKYKPKFGQKSNIGNDAQHWRTHDRSRGYTTRSGKLIQKLGGYVVNGYRPLPNREGRGFTWATNPYKGRGYWFLYHQGYIGGRGTGIDYVPRHFLFNAYNFILGKSVSKLLGSGNLKLTNIYKEQWASKIAIEANKELRK